MKRTNDPSSQAMNFVDGKGRACVDLVAGLASSLGHRHPDVCAAIRATCDLHLGSPLDFLPEDWHLGLGLPLADFDRCYLAPSASDANEMAILAARAVFKAEKYRVITLLGSDHGQTYAMRSASGRSECQGFDGPVAPGFRHVMPGEIAAMKKAIDPMTAAVCISPINGSRGGEPFDTEYLVAVESLCREHKLLLILDETQLPPGIGGSWFFYQRAGITPDIVTVSSGWMGGLPGGMTLFNNANFSDSDYIEALGSPRDFPLLRSIVGATSQAINTEHCLQKIDETADAWAAIVDELVSGFDFIRGCVHAGLWTTIDFDLPAIDVARVALAQGLRLKVTGESTLLICPPINITGDTLLKSIEPLRSALESIEQQTASS